MTDAGALGGKAAQRGGNPASEWLLLPREHGAWSMLLLPMLSALVLSAGVSLVTISALGAALAVFLLREPLVALLRQRLVWRDPRPETAVAQRSLMILLPILTMAGMVLVIRLPLAPVLAFGGVALGLVGAGAWVAIQNQQRSLAWQALAAVALPGGALFAAFAGERRLELWAWLVWLLFALHHGGAIFLVRARLEARIEAGSSGSARAAGSVVGKARAARRDALLAQVPLLVAAVWFALSGAEMLAVPPLASWVAHCWEWKTMEKTLGRPLKQVGFRALAVSVGFAALTLAALWVR